MRGCGSPSVESWRDLLPCALWGAPSASCRECSGTLVVSPCSLEGVWQTLIPTSSWSVRVSCGATLGTVADAVGVACSVHPIPCCPVGWVGKCGSPDALCAKARLPATTSTSESTSTSATVSKFEPTWLRTTRWRGEGQGGDPPGMWSRKCRGVCVYVFSFAPFESCAMCTSCGGATLPGCSSSARLCQRPHS